MTTRIARAVKLAAARPAPKRLEVEPSPAIPPEPRPTCPDEVRVRAYHKWVAAGRPPGDGACFWLDAEQELHQGR
jgi:hypothetical protein